MEGQKTLTDRMIQKIKNNPIFASIIIAGIIIIALVKSLNAIEYIRDYAVNLLSSPNISGEWISEVLTNRYSKKDTYRLFFNLEQNNEHLIGSVSEISTKPDGYVIDDTIQEGKVEKDKISFYVQISSAKGPYKQSYFGTLTKGWIEFSRQDSKDGVIEKFSVQKRTTTPLHQAALEGDERKVNKLLEKGTSANITNNYKSTPLHSVLRARRDLPQQMEDRATHYQKLLNVTKLLIEHGANVNAVDIYDMTPLLITTYTSQPDLDATRVLLHNGADPNIRISRNALICIAIEENHFELLKLFIEAKADLDIPCHTLSERRPQLLSERRPLHEAIHDQRYEMVKLLINAGANINLPGLGGLLPIHLLARTNQIDLIKLLLDEGADVNSHSQFIRDTPLHLAISDNRVEAVKFLIASGADVNAKGQYNNTPLHYAVLTNQETLVKILLNAGADVNPIRDDGYTPFHYAVDRRMNGIAKLLLNSGADINIAKNNGQTPLHSATLDLNKELVQLLLENGADVNKADKLGNTPLHVVASIKGYIAVEIAKMLIEKGADVNRKNNLSQTPLAIALSNKSEVAGTLQSNGGK